MSLPSLTIVWMVLFSELGYELGIRHVVTYNLFLVTLLLYPFQLWKNCWFNFRRCVFSPVGKQVHLCIKLLNLGVIVQSTREAVNHQVIVSVIFYQIPQYFQQWQSL